MTNAQLFGIYVFFVLIINIFRARIIGKEDGDVLLEASRYLLSGANLGIDPCENFYNYSCGSWPGNIGKFFGRNNNHENYDLWAKRASQLLTESMEVQRIRIKSPKVLDSVPNFVERTATFYEQCLKPESMPKNESMQYIYRYLGRHLGYPKAYNSSNTLDSQLDSRNILRIQAVLRIYFDVGLLFETDIRQILNSDGTEMSILRFAPAKPITNFESEKIRQQMSYLAEILKIRIDQVELRTLVGKIVSFSSDLNHLIAKTNQIDEVSKVFDFKTLTNISGSFDWPTFFKFLFTGKQFQKFRYHDATFMLSNGDYFSSLDQYLSNYDFDTVLTFALWRLVRDRLWKLKEMEIKSSKVDHCARMVKKLYAPSAMRLIFDNKGWNLTYWRMDINDCFNKIRTAFEFFILKSDWPDNEDKMNIINKAKHMSFYSGIPRWIENDTEVNRRTFEFDMTKSLLENEIDIYQQAFTSKLDRVVSRTLNEDAEPNFEVKAYYDNMRVVILLGHLLPPAYHPDYAMPLKFGLLGWTLAHQIFHGFDGNHLTETSRLLKRKNMPVYEMKKRCLKQKIGSFCSTKKDRCVTQTLAENMADVDGLKVAFMAYRLASSTQNSNQLLRGLTSMSPDQMFFLMVGRTYCQVSTVIH